MEFWIIFDFQKYLDKKINKGNNKNKKRFRKHKKAIFENYV